MLARELVARCELIDPVRLPEVEQLLVYLQNRQSSGRGGSAEGKYTCCVHFCCPALMRGRATTGFSMLILYATSNTRKVLGFGNCGLNVSRWEYVCWYVDVFLLFQSP